MERQGRRDRAQPPPAASGPPTDLGARFEAEHQLADARRGGDAFVQQRMRRLGELTDELVRCAEATRSQLSRFAAELERATAAVAADGPTVAASPPGPATDAEPPGARDVGPARLAAIEMAVGGRSRTDVDRYLRDSLRLRDTGALLDDVFGGAEHVTQGP